MNEYSERNKEQRKPSNKQMTSDFWDLMREPTEDTAVAYAEKHGLDASNPRALLAGVHKLRVKQGDEAQKIVSTKWLKDNGYRVVAKGRRV